MLRMHLALLAITLCVAVGMGIYPVFIRTVVWCLATAIVVAAPYWLLRGDWRLTLGMVVATAAFCTLALGPEILSGQRRAHPWAAALILPQLGVLVLLSLVMAFRLPAFWAEFVAVVAVVVLFAASVHNKPVSAPLAPVPVVEPRRTEPQRLAIHYLEGGGTPDPEMFYSLFPYSRSFQFYPTNPRNYFTDLGDAGPAHWFAWTLYNSAASPMRARVTLLGDKDQRVQLNLSGVSPDDGSRFSFRCDHWKLPVGGRCTAKFRARAGAAVEGRFIVERRGEPADSVSIGLEAQWQRFHFDIPAPAGEGLVGVAFDLPVSEAPVEIADFALFAGDQRVSCAAPLTRYMVEYQTNGMGFRGRDYPRQPSASTFRIACLGDSNTHGIGVHERDTFASVLERGLQQTASDEVEYEVINCGRPGYNTGNERVCYEREVRQYRPRVVILQICGNDFEWLPGDVNVFPTNDQIEPNADSYRRCQGEVVKLARLCRDDDAALVVMLFRMAEKAFGWAKIQDMLESSLREFAVPVLDVGVALERNGQSRDFWVHETDMHPNELAHRLAAEELHRLLAERQLLPAPK